MPEFTRMKEDITNHMVKDPILISEDEALMTLVELFNMTELSHVIVVSQQGEMQGIISKSDLFDKLKFLVKNTTGKTYTEKLLSKTTASDIMTCDALLLKANKN